MWSPGWGGGNSRGQDGEKGRAQAHLWCRVWTFSRRPEAFMPGRDEITFVVVDGSGCLCLGGEWRGQTR